MATTTITPTTLTSRINRIEVSATMAVVAEADKLRAGGADLTDFGAGEPHFATPAHIKDAAIQAIQQNFTKYTPVGGVAPLKDAIRQRHAKDFGSDYKREEVIASTGGKHALFNAIQVLVDHGDEVIVPVPYWVSFKDIIQYGGGVPVFVETDESRGFALTADMVERAITSRTKAIILNTPSNPSGAVMDPKDVEAIVRLAHSRGIYVIADECYIYLDYTGTRFSAASIADVNKMLIESERKLTTPEGLPGRPWFKHQIDAPGQYTGYEAKTIPAVREAIEQKQWKQADEAIVVVSRVLQDEAALVSAAAGKLAGAAGH